MAAACQAPDAKTGPSCAPASPMQLPTFEQVSHPMRHGQRTVASARDPPSQPSCGTHFVTRYHQLPAVLPNSSDHHTIQRRFTLTRHSLVLILPGHCILLPQIDAPAGIDHRQSPCPGDLSAPLAKLRRAPHRAPFHDPALYALRPSRHEDAPSSEAFETPPPHPISLVPIF